MNDSVQTLAPGVSANGDACTVPIRFWRAGRIHEISNPSPNQTLLEYLRSSDGLNACGTKEGCAEGDCGACTVVIAELANDSSSLRFRAINSCIRFTHQIDGYALWTVEDLSGLTTTSTGASPSVVNSQPQTQLHPVQQAMLEAHGSQCGFCTPGFVMSMFALYQTSQGRQVDRQAAIAALSGNLCRCTGYRPILDAAQAMMNLPRVEQPEAAIKAALLNLTQRRDSERAVELTKTHSNKSGGTVDVSTQKIFRPTSLESLLALRKAHPKAQLIAGATDIGLWVTKQGQRFEQVIDVSAARDLQHIRSKLDHLEIGAAVRLEDAYRALVASRPQVASFAHRFAGLPVRQSGTLGGNIANGSPIGDSMPLLIALGAKIRLGSMARGLRELALEDFYLAYRRTQLADDEVLTHILVPLPPARELSRIYKVSKRFEDDISAVCLGINIHLDALGDIIESVRIGVGGMAAIPTRAYKTEAMLLGKQFSEQTFVAARDSISIEFTPLDDMRATALYRRQVAGNLMLRFWQDLQEPNQINSLESFDVQPIVLHPKVVPLHGAGPRGPA